MPLQNAASNPSKNPKNSASFKAVVVTGGVISGLGKGVFSASLGALLSTSQRVIPIKCDGYLNTDPGTMNPIEHGEVFVLDDGGEVDLDFGHYERFIGVTAKKNWNITMGKVYQQILENERQGKYLGRTVQLIPHATDEIKRRIYTIAKQERAEVVLIEIGGTVGDIENELFIEAIRQMRAELGRENLFLAHLSYVPFLPKSREFKSKPTQFSVSTLNQAGLYPNLIICRSQAELTPEVRKKISLYCSLSPKSVLPARDVEEIYSLPQYLEREGVSKLLAAQLSIKVKPTSRKRKKLVNNLLRLKKNSRSAVPEFLIFGKYTTVPDSYLSIQRALIHASAHHKANFKVRYLDTSRLGEKKISALLSGASGVIVPGGFGTRGIAGKLRVIRYARENHIPFLGICLGMQLAVVEFARQVCGIKNANTSECLVEHPKLKITPVVSLLPSQAAAAQVGASMRLGGQEIRLLPGTKARKLFGRARVRERFRHRYEINPAFVPRIKEAGKEKMVFSGESVNTTPALMQLLELPSHPFFIACQFHPELTSRLEHPSPLFSAFFKAGLAQNQKLSQKPSSARTASS